MREKLLRLMKTEGLTQSRLAELLDVQPAGISHLLAGRNKPGFDLLQKMLRRFPRLNPDWLLLDQGEMYRADVAAADAHSDKERVEELPHAPAPENSAGQPSLFTAPAAASPQPEPRVSATEESRKVVRIALFYSDGTFESYNAK